MDTICHDKTIIEKRTYRDLAPYIGDPFITLSTTLDDMLIFLDEDEADMDELTIITMTKRIKNDILVEARVEEISSASSSFVLERINDYHSEYRVGNQIRDYLNVNGTKITISRFIGEKLISVSLDEDEEHSICFSRRCNMFISENNNTVLKMIYNQVKDWRDDERLTINF